MYMYNSDNVFHNMFKGLRFGYCFNQIKIRTVGLIHANSITLHPARKVHLLIAKLCIIKNIQTVYKCQTGRNHIIETS